MLNAERIGFRRLTLEELPLMHHWINREPIRQIWAQGEELSLADITSTYGPRITREAPTDPYLILYGETPIGYIQTYLWRNYPDYAQYLPLDEEAASLDLFIGQDEYRGQGLGPVILARFLREIVFADPRPASCVITPEAANVQAIHAYEKAGFRHLQTLQVPGEPGPIYLMRIGRPH